MGLFDKTPKKAPKSSLFDLNKDGKMDAGEQYIAYKIFQDVTKDMGKKPGKGGK